MSESTIAPRERLARIRRSFTVSEYETRTDGSILIGVEVDGWWSTWLIPADGGRAVEA